MIASGALLVASLLVPAPERTLAVDDDRVCAVAPSGRDIRCLRRGELSTQTLPDDVEGRVVDLHTGAGLVCARTEPSDVALCWVVGERTPLERIEQAHDVAWGRHHRCVLRDEGAFECWGNNDHGQLGDDTRVYRASPTPVALPPALALSASKAGTCALLEDRTVRCWGDNAVWGDRRRLTPAPIPGVTNVEKLLPDRAAILADGSLVSWSVVDADVPVFSEPEVLGTSVSTASVGRSSCSIVDGAVACRGPSGDTWTTVPGVTDAVEVDTGDFLACARDSTRETTCWVLGGTTPLPDTPFSWTPARIDGLPPAQSITVADDAACIRTRAGEVWCWRDAPRRVELPTAAVELHAAGHLSCARGRDAIWCWDRQHPVPRETFTEVDVRRFVPGRDDQVCVGGRKLQCSDEHHPGHVHGAIERPFTPELMVGNAPCIRKRGQLQCWSKGYSGKPSTLEEDAFDTRDLKTLFAHGDDVCGLYRRGRLTCNEPLATSCETGRYARRCRDAAVEAELEALTTVALADSIGCGLDRSGAVYCWRPYSEDPPPAPDPLRTIDLPGPARSIAAAEGTACAVLEDRTVWCWGDAAGPIGPRHQPGEIDFEPTAMPWLDR